MDDKDRFFDIIERNLLNQERLVKSFEKYEDTQQAMSQNIQTLINHSKQVNDSFHHALAFIKDSYDKMEKEKDKRIEEKDKIKERLIGWLFKCILAIMALLGGTGILKLFGVL